MDFGCITIDPTLKLYLFGTPGPGPLRLHVGRPGRGRARRRWSSWTPAGWTTAIAAVDYFERRACPSRSRSTRSTATSRTPSTRYARRWTSGRSPADLFDARDEARCGTHCSSYSNSGQNADIVLPHFTRNVRKHALLAVADRDLDAEHGIGQGLDDDAFDLDSGLLCIASSSAGFGAGRGAAGRSRLRPGRGPPPAVAVVLRRRVAAVLLVFWVVAFSLRSLSYRKRVDGGPGRIALESRSCAGKISAPPGAMATVCSKWADRLLSAVTMVQPSSRFLICLCGRR